MYVNSIFKKNIIYFEWMKEYQFFTEQLIAAGVNEITAEEDACRIEHAISDESFHKLQKYFMKPK